MTVTSETGVTEALRRCREEGRAALIGYLPVGFPDRETSLRAMAVLVEAGCDVVEVGMPYTDPVLDGPVIQRAADQALRGGAVGDDVFAAVRAVRDAGGQAVVMTYWNLVLRRGVERYAAELAAAGGSGLITPDLVPDEAGEWIAASDRHGLDRVFLVAPSSTPQRLATVLPACRGFVYAAAVMGVTGARGAVGSAAPELVARVREVSDLPVGVGIGVSTRQQAAEVASFADAVIVGSAIVACLLDREPEEGLAELRRLVEELARGVREGRS